MGDVVVFCIFLFDYRPARGKIKENRISDLNASLIITKSSKTFRGDPRNGCGTTLLDDKKGKLLVYHLSSWTIRATVFELGGSNNVVSNFYKVADYCGKKQ